MELYFPAERIGRSIFSCNYRLSNGSQFFENCLHALVVHADCETTDKRKVKCRVTPFDLVAQGGVTLIAKTDSMDVYITKYTLYPRENEVIFECGQIVQSFQLLIQRSITQEVTYTFNIDKIFKLNLKTNAVMRAAGVVLTFSVPFGPPYSVLGNETQVHCGPLYDPSGSVPRTIHNVSYTLIPRRNPPTCFTCKARLRSLFDDRGYGIWSTWSNDVEFFSGTRIPAPEGVHGMLHRLKGSSEGRCRFYFFNTTEKMRNYSVQVGNEKPKYGENVDIEFPCRGKKFTSIRLSNARRCGNLRSDAHHVKFAMEDMFLEPVGLQMTKVSENNYGVEAIGVPDRMIKEAFLVICKCDSECWRSSARCEHLRRIWPIREPLEFAVVKINPEWENVSLYISFMDFPHYSMSDWFEVPGRYQEVSEQHVISMVVTVISIMAIIVSVFVGIVKFGKPLSFCSRIFEDPSSGNLYPKHVVQGKGVNSRNGRDGYDTPQLYFYDGKSTSVEAVDVVDKRESDQRLHVNVENTAQFSSSYLTS